MHVLECWQTKSTTPRTILTGSGFADLGPNVRRKEIDRRFRIRNKDQRNNYSRLYRFRNPDKVVTREVTVVDLKMKEYETSRNKDKRRESKRQYYFRNKDRIGESLQQYYVRTHKTPDIYLRRNDFLKSWKSPELVRDYFSSVAGQLQISKHSDWYRVSRGQLCELGGV